MQVSGKYRLMLIGCFIIVLIYFLQYKVQFVEEVEKSTGNAPGYIERLAVPENLCPHEKWNGTDITEFHDWFQEIIPHMEHLNRVQKNNLLEGHIWNLYNKTFLRMPQLCVYYSHLRSNRNNIKTVCEIGFNGGHSALMYSSIFEGNINIISFDLCKSGNCEMGKREILKLFPNVRLQIVPGDSTEVVPSFLKKNPDVKCDFISIDGGHFGTVPLTDIRNMRPFASRHHTVVIDDVNSKSPHEYLKTVGMAWETAIGEGTVRQTGECNFCYTKASFLRACKFCFGKYTSA